MLVKVSEAHIVALYFADLLTVSFNLSTNVVLSLHAKLAGLIEANETVGFVSELNLSSQLMAHIAHEDVENIVTRVVKSNLLSILELNLLEAMGCEVGRLHAHFDAVTRPAFHCIGPVGSFNQKV